MAMKPMNFKGFSPFSGDCITVQNARVLRMEGVERVHFCSEERIVLQGKTGLEVDGEKLNLIQLGNDNIEITGKILHVHFLERFR